MSRYDISMTPAAKAAAENLKQEGKALRFSVARSGCCSVSVSIFPDVERVTDRSIEVDGCTVVMKDEYPDLTWRGVIDYKEKGLKKGFLWR